MRVREDVPDIGPCDCGCGCGQDVAYAQRDQLLTEASDLIAEYLHGPAVTDLVSRIDTVTAVYRTSAAVEAQQARAAEDERDE